MSRPAKTKPATAYDYRRAIHLVQMIASGLASENHMRDLADDWHVPVAPDATRDELLHAIALHAMDKGRENYTGIARK